MVHVGALPGTPKNKQSVKNIIAAAVCDARVLADGGVDAIMIENMHDRPYLNRNVGPEVVAAMTALAYELRNVFTVPLGVQILAGANKDALAVALAADFDFIRAEGFVFGHLADEGIMNSDAGELLRYRKRIGAERIHVFADVKKKHSAHAISADVSIEETASAAEFFLVDGVIVTGSATGEKASLKDVKAVKDTVTVPVLIGSGIDERNIKDYWNFADGFIIGSSFKKDGRWENKVDPQRVKSFMQTIKEQENNGLFSQ